MREAAAREAARVAAAMAGVPLVRQLGQVHRVLGMLIEGTVPGASIGELCEVYHPAEPAKVWRCEVVGFTGPNVLLSSLMALEGISGGCVIRPLRTTHHVAVGRPLLGRILDGFGDPLDGGEPLRAGVDGLALRRVIADAPPT